MHLKGFIYTFLLLLFSSVLTVRSQEANWEIGLSAGGAGYMGDLNQNNPLQISGFNAGVFVKRNFNPYLGAKLNYNYGQIKGDDANSSSAQFRERNLRFNTSLSEIGAQIDFNFFKFSAGSGGKAFSPYVYTGAGVVIFKPTAKYNNETYRLDWKFTEGQVETYKNYALTIPYGVGMKYNYKDYWTVFTEIGYRTAFTDYLDDVSGNYPANPAIVGNAPYQVNLSNPSLNLINVAGTQRGDFRKRDTYLFVSVGISFTFVNSKCYSF